MKQDLTKAENRLKEFREKNRQVLSPQILLEQERLIRDVQINASIYTELRKQYEIVKIEEVKNIPVINVLDSARTPAKKNKPNRIMLVLSTIFISIVGSMGYILMRHRFEKQISELIVKLQLIQKWI